MATLFTKIINKEIMGTIFFEDDRCAVIKDINPAAPDHWLVVPKKEIPSLAHADKKDCEVLGHLLWTVAECARKMGVSENGYRVVINTGKNGGQTVDHLHVHLLGGRALGWPPG